MRRLTKQDEQGNWCLKGLPWKDTYVGQIITKNTSEKTYGALCKLKDYEESGMDPEEVCSLKERDTATKLNDGECRNCGNDLVWMRDSEAEFCPYCGQRLDWSE